MAANPASLPTVLVCDDLPAMRSLVQAALSGTCSVIEAEDGDEAVAVAEQARPDLVIVDGMMPGRSGLDVVAFLRGHSELARVPVIMLTARAQASDEEAALAAGVDLFVRKPFSPAQLVTDVTGLLQR